MVSCWQKQGYLILSLCLLASWLAQVAGQAPATCTTEEYAWWARSSMDHKDSGGERG
jgi:hypothetical protein